MEPPELQEPALATPERPEPDVQAPEGRGPDVQAPEGREPDAQVPDGHEPEPQRESGRVTRAISWSKTKSEQATEWSLGAREKHPSVDVGFRAADRDKRVAASVLAGGVAYRFFFWMLAVSLLTNGALGFINAEDLKAGLESEGVDASIAASIQQATEPSDTGRWWLLVVGLWLVLWTGYTGAKALVRVHAAVWGMPPPPVRRLIASGLFTGTMLAFVAAMAAAQWLRTEFFGPGIVATVGLVIVPFTIWFVASGWLPHQDVGWMGLVPGAILVALGIQGLHIFTVYFLGPKLASATELYGVLGIVSTILFWLYIAGRLVIGAATLNASMYEQRTKVDAVSDP